MRAVLVMLLVLGMVPALLQAQGGASAAAAGEGQPAEQAGTENNFVVQRESVPEKAAPAKTPKVVYNPQKRRDPTLSPDDVLILEDRARKLRIAQEQERKRREAAEKAERERQERLRQRQLLLLKYPELEVKDKIRIGGVIGREVFFGNSNKMYTVGSTLSVKGESGARRKVKIEAINLDSVVFSYQGRRFKKKI